MSEPAPVLAPKKLTRLLVGMLIVPVLVIGGYMLLKRGSKSEVSGSIQLGKATPFEPNRCESGVLSEDAPRSRAQFHGVDIFQSEKPKRRVRVFEDPEKGEVVTLRTDGEAPVVVDRKACSKFEVQLKETGSMILDHYGLEGALVLDCAEVVADVKFASCYDGS